MSIEVFSSKIFMGFTWLFLNLFVRMYYQHLSLHSTSNLQFLEFKFNDDQLNEYVSIKLH